jgi:hypothetical protein
VGNDWRRRSSQPEPLLFPDWNVEDSSAGSVEAHLNSRKMYLSGTALVSKQQLPQWQEMGGEMEMNIDKRTPEQHPLPFARVQTSLAPLPAPSHQE